MPEFIIGNMWDAWDKSDLFLITANSYIKTNGELTMGRGMAKQAKERDDQIALYFGREIKPFHLETFGIAIPNMWPLRKEGAFQTKRHWQDRAEVELIEYAVKLLLQWIEHFPDKRVDLNYPGIGLGGLDRMEVKPFLNHLPDNVNIWSRE